MLKNKNILLLIIIIALGLLVWGVSTKNKLEDNLKQPNLNFSSKIDHLEISNGQTIILEKKDDQWLLKEGEKYYPASNDQLEKLIGSLKDFQVVEIVSKNQDKYQTFQLDDQSAKLIKWFMGDQEKGRLYLGKTDYARQGDYVRIGKNKTVYLSSDNLNFILQNNFKDLTVWDLDQDKIQKIVWDYGKEDQNLELFKSQSNNQEEENNIQWFLKTASNQNQEIKTEQAEAVLGQIKKIKAQDLLEFNQDKDYGLENYFCKISIINTNGKEHSLVLGAQADEIPAYYAEISGQDNWIYLIGVAKVDQKLALNAEDFKQTFDK